jgi:DNA-directed RNA polymerase sigma subunit (sigma70/sigma32)
MSSSKTFKLPADIQPRKSEDYFYENGEMIILPITDMMDETPELEELTLREGLEVLDRYFRDILTPREAQVLRMNFGLGEYPRPRMFDEIGDVFDLTCERVRQIKVKALRKLRNEMSEEVMEYFQ